MDELDRILTDDPEIQPTIGFSTRVMRAVREEAESMAPIAFPWARFLPGLCVSLVLLATAVVGWFSEAASSLPPSPLPAGPKTLSSRACCGPWWCWQEPARWPGPSSDGAARDERPFSS